MSSGPEGGRPFVDGQFALEFTVAGISAAGAYLCRIHAFGLDMNGTGFLKLLIAAIGLTLWMGLRLIFRIRE